jgi:pantetheine-phosphate adenylyltransferase
VIVRGLRAVSDFEYEFQMVAMNQRMNHNIETVFLMADPAHQAVSSRLVKEIARLGGRSDLFVPADVQKRLAARYGVKKA